MSHALVADNVLSNVFTLVATCDMTGLGLYDSRLSAVIHQINKTLIIQCRSCRLE